MRLEDEVDSMRVNMYESYTRIKVRLCIIIGRMVMVSKRSVV